jgi:hypothetical protein
VYQGTIDEDPLRNYGGGIAGVSTTSHVNAHAAHTAHMYEAEGPIKTPELAPGSFVLDYIYEMLSALSESSTRSKYPVQFTWFSVAWPCLDHDSCGHVWAMKST